MYNVLIISTYFVEMLISFSFFSQLGKKKYNNLFCFIFGLGLFLSGAFFDIVLESLVWFNGIYFLLINILFGFVCFEIKKKLVMFYSVILEIFNASLEVLAIFLISNITGTEITAYLNDISFLILDGVVSKLLYFFACMITARFLTKNYSIVKLPITLYFYPIAIIAMMIVFWNICAYSNLPEKYKLALSIVSGVLFISTVVLVMNFQHNLEKENKLIMLEKTIEKEATEQKYYEILEKQNQELMIYAHDTKKHLAAIRELSENKQINDYLSKMNDELKEHSKACHSGNHTLDVIINRYQTECNINKISFKYDLKTTNLSIVEDYDLVTIIGNVLDNALEAARNSNQRMISLETNRRNDFDVIIITNSCDNPPDKDLSTTKKNKKLHGYGMKSVAKTLKKYDGDYEWEYDKELHIFTTTIMISAKV